MALRGYKPLASSNIAGCDYEDETQKLTVLFTSGGRYEYDDVPEDVYNDLISAPSPGRYFASEIKDQFRFKRL